MKHDVTRRESTFWPWVVGIVVLAAVIAVAARVTSETERDMTPAGQIAP